MAFTVFLYNFSKKENSTAQPTAGVSFSCVLKDDSAILNPVLLFNIGTETFPTSYNYAYIPSYNRYYWISEWTWIEGIWKAALTVDILASWKSYIGNTSAYILRSASASNGAIIDTQYPMTSEIINNISLANNAPWLSAISQGIFVVGIIGRSAQTVGAVSYYVFTPLQFKTLCNYLFLNVGDWLDLAKIAESIPAELLKAQFNPFQYIVSCTWFPFAVGNLSLIDRIQFGWWEFTMNAYAMPSGASRTTTLGIKALQHPQSGRGSWINTSPYTTMMLFYHPFGWIELDPQQFIGVDTITTIATVDMVSGIGRLEVGASGGSTAGIYYAAVGVPIQLSQINTDLLGAAGNIVSGIAGLVSTSPLATLANGIGNAYESLKPKLQTVGTNGGFSGFATYPYIAYTFHTIADADNAKFGSPLCATRTIGTLSGYVLCASATVSAPATSAELESINSFLNSGFYYE